MRRSQKCGLTSEVCPRPLEAARRWFLTSKHITAVLPVQTLFGMVEPETATRLRDIVVALFGA